MAIAGWKTNKLRTYYHRSGKKALGLVRFDVGGVHQGYTEQAEMG